MLRDAPARGRRRHFHTKTMVTEDSFPNFSKLISGGDIYPEGD
jgi:hypothetical protein